jgi:hypothetical protein
MKWVWSNGLRLIVRDVGPILVQVDSLKVVPLPIILPTTIMDDNEAREVVRQVLGNKNYKRVI